MTRYEYENEPATRAQTDRIDRTVDGLLDTVNDLISGQEECNRSLKWVIFWLASLWAVVFIIAVGLALAPEAEGHARYVYLHNHNDSGWVTSGHNRLVACDGTDNGDTFGVQGKTRSGNMRTLWDDGPGQSCNISRGGGIGDFPEIRWIEQVGGHVRHGEWRGT